MKKQFRQIAKFVAAILIVQAVALLFLTPQGMEFLFPPVARVHAEKFEPESNTYAVYYDTRVEISNADLIVVGIDFGIAESYDLLGHFTRFAKQYNNYSAVLLDLQYSQQSLAQNLLSQTEEDAFMKRISWLTERTGLPTEFCDYLSEIFLINRTVTDIREVEVLTYTAPGENDSVENAAELAAMTKAERVFTAYRSTERSALCVVDCEDLRMGSDFRRGLDTIAKAAKLNVMYLQVQYNGSCAEGEGHPTYRFPDYHTDPTVFFVDNSGAAWFYRYYAAVAGLNRDKNAVENSLDSRFTDHYFVIVHGTAIQENPKQSEKEAST